ncbi:MAG: gliding motility protein GldL [Bacteroidales bacterium]|jgi:gliding motility-associated protein GldL|nr:gliding motility protein GldL [Bacteroidales bacterium]
MGLAELTQSSGWKKFMAKLYGWGAAVVIVGALFKIQHWPGAGIMLTVGLLTEAIIFFFSAFEPLHEELDWTLVYPELAGMTDPDELEGMKEVSKSSGALERFDDLMGGLGGIDPSIVKSLNASFDKLNSTAGSISDVSQATAATTKYVQNVSAAAESVGSLSATFQQSAVGLQQSATAINSSSAAMAAISGSSRGYASQLDGMNKNLAALNAVYELQLRSTNEQVQKSQGIYSGMEKMMSDMKASVDETHRYREEMASLNRNLASLNTIYGNMLSAMNVRG